MFRKCLSSLDKILGPFCSLYTCLFYSLRNHSRTFSRSVQLHYAYRQVVKVVAPSYITIIDPLGDGIVLTYYKVVTDDTNIFPELESVSWPVCRTIFRPYVYIIYKLVFGVESHARRY